MALFIGFAIKIPAFPFHTWLPDAHVEAPTAISVILAGVLLKIGTYGILRVNYGILPEASADLAYLFLGVLGAVNIVYGALCAMAQTDLKKLVAYSGIPPLAGFVGKFYLFAAVIREQYYVLALIAGINGVAHPRNTSDAPASSPLEGTD